MPLLFLLAGASTWFALRHRTGGQYGKERFLRLLVPLLFGLLVVIPPQIYFDLLHHNPGYDESYMQFYPRFFSTNPEGLDAYAGGFELGHLWFILYLFLFSLIALPLFRYLRNETGRRIIERLARYCTKSGVIFLFTLPIFLLGLTPIRYPNPLYFLIFFIYGYILVSDVRFEESIDTHKSVALIVGPVSYGIWLSIVAILDITVPGWVWSNINFYHSLVTWCALIALLGYGRQFLNFTNTFLKYYGEASYPLYILHQTFVIAVGYYVVQLNAGILVKLVIIIIATFVATIFLYDLFVRRISFMRLLFGMKKIKRS
jgi:peptidoglycan/LPS O-acetylase OafA/YrhL